MKNEIVGYKHNVLTPSIWEMIQNIAPTIKDARYFGVARVEQAQAIMLKGHELGLPLTTSFEYIFPIQDKLSLSPRGAMALIYKSGLLADLKVDIAKDGKSVSVWMKRTSGIEFGRSFSVSDGKKAGLIKSGGGWEKYETNMCQWRATGFTVDFLFPDVTGGLYMYDALGGDITPEGDPIVEPEWTVESKTPQIAIEDLLSAGFTAEQILDVNDGSIPTTSEDCKRVWDDLEVKYRPVSKEGNSEVES